VPAIFGVIQKRGRVDQDEMYRVFNMGIGLILIVPQAAAEGVMARAVELGERAYRIGEIVASGSEDRQVEYVG
jgi:phosphoribosylformylglycinamidine cyclo-ligase